MTLEELPLGQSARVVAVGGQRSFRRRLLELGLVPGTTLEVQRVAPLGDPLFVAARGGYLSMRRLEAASVEVSPVNLTDSKTNS